MAKTPTAPTISIGIKEADRKKIADGLSHLLADTYTLYLTTHNFHWNVTGPMFTSLHTMFMTQYTELWNAVDPIAERIRKIGGQTLRSIGQIDRMKRIADNDADYVEPSDMLAELCEDNKALAVSLREAHEVTSDARDFATTSMIENFLDETERRTWFLFEASRRGDSSGH